MVKTFLLLSFLIFSIVGMCDFIYVLRMLFLYPNTYTKNYSLIFLKKGIALRQLNFIWQKIRWNGNAFAVGIIAIIDDLESEEILLCEKFKKDKNIILCSADSAICQNVLQGELTDGNRK